MWEVLCKGSHDRKDVTAVLGQQYRADTAPRLTEDGEEDPGGLSSGLREAGMYERDPATRKVILPRELLPLLSFLSRCCRPAQEG